MSIYYVAVSVCMCSVYLCFCLYLNFLYNMTYLQGRNLGSTFGGVCSYNARQIGRGLRIARRKVQYYTWLLGG